MYPCALSLFPSFLAHPEHICNGARRQLTDRMTRVSSSANATPPPHFPYLPFLPILFHSRVWSCASASHRKTLAHTAFFFPDTGCPPPCRHAAIKLGPKRQPIHSDSTARTKPATGSCTCAAYDRNHDHGMAQAATSFTRVDQPFGDDLYRGAVLQTFDQAVMGKAILMMQLTSGRMPGAGWVYSSNLGGHASPGQHVRTHLSLPPPHEGVFHAKPTKKAPRLSPSAYHPYTNARPPPPDTLTSLTKAMSGTRRERTRRAAAAQLPTAAAASASASEPPPIPRTLHEFEDAYSPTCARFLQE
ncbi:hypothetical protein F5148DRAFT_1153040 [Russula earlei]|uniref:Uncharacterized protein n=1 Tax=Russula earlei TaxID=71964 RepID=A0ACC0TVN6_9AGAM|nr:hypothetical protein F5148DRAFT_1153040 [Russula earlei]